MKMYLISLAAGILVGIVYSLLHVRSPAPPVVALIGLAGMLIGEQFIPIGKQLFSGTAFVTACNRSEAKNHIFGQLPGRLAAKEAQARGGSKS